MSPFKKGNIPWNKGRHGVYSKETILKMSNSRKGQPSSRALELGSELEDNGYIRVKISNHPNYHTRWRLKHHIIYEKYHPNIKIGKTDRVIFLDGNKRNFDIHNLKLVSLSEQAYIANISKSQYKYNSDEKLELIELIKANLKIKKIEKLIQEKYSGN